MQKQPAVGDSRNLEMAIFGFLFRVLSDCIGSSEFHTDFSIGQVVAAFCIRKFFGVSFVLCIIHYT